MVQSFLALTVVLATVNFFTTSVVQSALSLSVNGDFNSFVALRSFVTASVIGVTGSIAALLGFRKSLKKHFFAATGIVVAIHIGWTIFDLTSFLDVFFAGSVLGELAHRSVLGVVFGYFVLPLLAICLWPKQA